MGLFKKNKEERLFDQETRKLQRKLTNEEFLQEVGSFKGLKLKGNDVFECGKNIIKDPEPVINEGKIAFWSHIKPFPEQMTFKGQKMLLEIFLDLGKLANMKSDISAFTKSFLMEEVLKIMAVDLEMFEDKVALATAIEKAEKNNLKK